MTYDPPRSALQESATTGTALTVLSSKELVQAGQQAKAHIDAAERHKDKTEEQYKAAGSYLVRAKASLKHGQWLPWLEKMGIAERTARFCMQVYGESEVLERERERHRTKNRKARKSAVRTADLADPVQEPCDDCVTQQEQWARSASNILANIASMRAFWKREFGDWTKFERSTALITLAKQADAEWKELTKAIISRR